MGAKEGAAHALHVLFEFLKDDYRLSLWPCLCSLELIQDTGPLFN